MQLHDLSTLEHLGASVIREANQQLNHWHRYGAPLKINAMDVLYRTGPLAGSYIFYRVLMARHPVKPDGNSIFSDVIRAKVTKRGEIVECRKLLRQMLHQELYPD